MIVPADLQTAGVSLPSLRIALNTGNKALVQTDSSGDLRGVAREVGEALARCAGKEPVWVRYGSADQILSRSGDDAWDIAFLAQDARRRQAVEFSEPFLSMEATCLVRVESDFRSIEDLDRPGVQISATKNAAYANALRSRLRWASVIEFDTSSEALDQFEARSLHAVAGITEALQAKAEERSALRILDRCFEVIHQSIATPKSGIAMLPLINRFVADWRATH